MARIIWLAAAAGAAVLTAAVSAAETPKPEAAVWRLDLAKALPGGKAMEVYLETAGGRFVRAFALAPQFNQVPHDVDASGLALDGPAVRGDLAVTVHSDGFVPPPGQSVKAAYRLQARVEGDGVTGTFEGVYGGLAGGVLGEKMTGAVAGALAATPLFHGPVLVDLHMENAEGEVPSGKAAWGQRGFASFIFKDGRAVHALIRGHGGNPINYFEAAVTAADLAWKDGALAGTARVKSTKNEEYVYTFKGQVIGDRIGGAFEKTYNGRSVQGGRFRGTVSAVPEVPADRALYYLELHGAVPGGKQLMLHLPASGGALKQGAGFAGTFNHTYHDADASGLKREGDALAGTVRVTMNPDPYVPPDHRPVACTYDIKAAVRDGGVTGAFTGTFGGRDVAGTVLGRLRPQPPVPEPVRVNVKLDNGVCDGPPWHRRCYIGFTAAKGRADAGGFSNNKGGFQGRFKSAIVRFDGAAFKATIEAVVETSGSVKKGDYTFLLAGKVVGGELVGKVDTILNGQPAKQGTDFMGSFGPAKQEAQTKNDESRATDDESKDKEQ
jgi:hypothetical protein